MSLAIVVAGTAVLLLGTSSASAIVAGAGFTTNDPAVDGPGTCLNGNSDPDPAVNCNLYASKSFVWINGGPSNGQSTLTDGTYFFAVLEPGGQNDSINDGGPQNLSDANPLGGVADPNLCVNAPTNTDTGCGDDYTSREFTVQNHQVTSYLGGGHATDSSYAGTDGLFINLMPYDSTHNPGGVYILAICQLNTEPSTSLPVQGTVTSSDCKYDAFKAPSPTCTENCTPTPFGSLAGEKYYDANANGQLDSGEVGIAGWKIDLSDSVNETLTTDSSGAFSESNLAPDTYTLAEEQATNQKCVTEVISGVSTLVCSPIWLQSGNVVDQSQADAGSSVTLNSDKSYTVALGDTGTVSQLYFGNLCLGGGGGLTLGFWSNKNGQKIMKAGDNFASALAFLDALNLRNGSGAAFDPTTYTQFRNWLLGAKATNMAYMLSAQLAAMELNVRYGFVAGTALVYAPGAQGANINGFISISALMSEANAALGANGLTKAGSPDRSYQEALKTALDRANNNLNFVQSGPGGCPAPTFS